MARKGLPKWAIKRAKAAKAKNIFAYAWSLVKRGAKPSRSPGVTKVKGVRKGMAKRKVKRRRSSFTLPLGIVIPVAYGVGEPLYWGISQKMPLDEILRHLLYRYTGIHMWSGRWAPNLDDKAFLPGLPALLIGVVVHKIVSMLGVNRMLARAKVPLVRI